MAKTSSILDLYTVDISPEDALVIIDQTLLPGEIKLLSLTKLEDIWEAIKVLRVRGAPAIGVAAAIGSYVAVAHSGADSGPVLQAVFQRVTDYLRTARPTAVNLFWALDQMDNCAKACASLPVAEQLQTLRQKAVELRDQDIAVCRKLGEYGLTLLKPGDGVLTHCNAGQLATVKYGTATATLYLALEQNYNLKIFADETRPLLQGARLTAFELHSAGADVTLICDNMAATVMSKGWVQAVFVGCDRVAANGDTANKIGTNGVAILAKHYGIPVYICAPSSTIDFNTPTGADIVIEQRDPEEVTDLWYKEKMSAPGMQVFNPAFDVTDHSLIAGIITEFGIAQAPYGESLAKLCGEKN